LRASKDGRTHGAEQHPSRRGEDAAPQDDGGDSFTTLGMSTGGSARRANHLRTRNPVQPLREKYFALFLTQISCVFRASHPTRGALRTSRNARWDAMDAKFAKDDRKRSRTAKSCGPDAPMAGVKFSGSSRFLGTTVTNKLRSRRGEHEISCSTIAQGRPECFR
jgi:hypothetical protein